MTEEGSSEEDDGSWLNDSYDSDNPKPKPIFAPAPGVARAKVERRERDKNKPPESDADDDDWPGVVNLVRKSLGHRTLVVPSTYVGHSFVHPLKADSKKMWLVRGADGSTITRLWGTLEDLEYALPDYWHFHHARLDQGYAAWRRSLQITDDE